jgi:vacuolar protein sorting-associated protein 33A
MLTQQRHGFFPRILGKGDNARKLANLLVRGRKELDVEDSSGYSDGVRGMLPSATLDSLIIIDRDVDFATLLLTQLTYEGLIEETVGIQHNQAEVDSSITGTAPQPSNQQAQSSTSTNMSPPSTTRQSLKTKIKLDSSDSLYSQLRSTNFAIVGSLLNKLARRLESDYELRHSARTTTELGDFVKKLPVYQQEHQSLRIHTNLAEEIMKQTRSETFSRVLEVQQNIAAGTDATYQHDTIEELIARDVSLPTILRLLCLESCISGGLRPRDLEAFKRQILHAYGSQHLLTLDALEKTELLQPRSSANALLLPIPGTGNAAATTGANTPGTKTNYNYLRKVLRLIMDEVNEQDPNDIAYVYSGYAPLSVRIIQCILQKPFIQSLNRSPFPLTPASTGWQGFEDVLKSAKGPTFTITQKAGDEKAVKARDSLKGSGGGPAAGWKTVYVLFLGGITFTEIAALRFVGRQLEGEKKRLMVCTTGVVSGNKVMDMVVEKKGFAGGGG